MARIFFLGAGFSRPAGLPLAAELLELVLEDLHAFVGNSTHLHTALDRYRSFLADTEGEVPDPIDVERFAEFLDYQHFLGLLGSDTWADEGNRDQYLLRWGIGRVIHRLTPKVPPDLYLAFAARLEPDDVIVSFNYDNLIEMSLSALDKRYRRFPSRFSGISMMSATVDSEAEEGEILLSKLHGSIDWISRATFDQTQALYMAWGDPDTAEYSRSRDLVFGPNAITQIRPLVEGPRPDDDILSTIEQVADLDAYYSNHLVAYSHPPLLLPPSRAKQLYGDPLRPFWNGMGRLGYVWGGVNVVGYSLPSDDAYTRQVLWELVAGYTAALTDASWRIVDVNRIAVVDLRATDLEKDLLLAAYRFFPTAHTDFVTTGFDEKALDVLFPTMPYGRKR